MLPKVAAGLGLLLLLALTPPEARSRAGGGENYSGGGGSSYDSSSGGDSSGGYRSGSGNDALAGFLIEAFFKFVWKHPAIGIPVTLALAFLVFVIGSAGNDRRIANVITRGEQAQQSLEMDGQLAKLRGRDPGFDPRAFVARAQTAFLKVQEAWSAQGMAGARAFLSDGVFERFGVLLAMQAADGLRNVMEQTRVISTAILQIESDDHFDTLHVRVQASAVDTMVAQGGRVVRGENAAEEFVEIWSFLRRPGAQSLKKPGLIEGFCPNCGAPLELADAAKCAVCESWVNSGEFDWVLSEITQACEWCVREPRAVQGLAPLVETDPALNVQFLEDRASTTFWRWQLAMFEGIPARMKSAALDDYCRQLGSEMGQKNQFFRNPAVGGVEVLAFESGEPFDLAHVLVKWSGEAWRREASGAGRGEQVVRQHVFTLARKTGAVTDPRSGLSSLRCAGCGASPKSSDTAQCEYCGAGFNDGSRHWVVAAVTPAGLWRRPPLEDGRPAPVTLDWSQGLSPADGLAVMVAAMLADGQSDPRELAFIETYARKRAIPQEKTSELIAAAQAGRLEAPKPKSGEEAEQMLRGLIHMSLADGSVSAGEMKTLTAFGGRLSVSAPQLRALVKEERNALFRKAREALAARPGR